MIYNNEIEFNDIVKSIGQTFYLTIPIDEARKIGLQKKDAVRVRVLKLQESEEKKHD